MATGARSSLADGARAVVLFPPTFDGWDLPAYDGTDGRRWIAGGERTLLEIAAAAACAGWAVELRGRIVEREVAAVEAAAGVTLERPAARRLTRATDVVIMPEGVPDPLLFARIAFSPARAVVAVLGAPGLFGWAFDCDGARQDLLTVDPASVGRPEQLEAARALGLELWTNLREIAKQAESRGIPHHYIAVGRPASYPEPSPKKIDVATLGDNKWAPLTGSVLSALRPSVTTVRLSAMPRDELLRALGTARILVHPVRVEGRSRVCEEARAMRTVPVMLTSNHLAEGLGPGEGGVGVDTVEAIAPAVHALLDDRERLSRLADDGYLHARRIADWREFVTRVADALANPDTEVACYAGGRGALGASLRARELARETAWTDRARDQADVEAQLRAELASSQGDARMLAGELDAANARYLALRSRKVVRAGLRATSLLKPLRARDRRRDK